MFLRIIIWLTKFTLKKMKKSVSLPGIVGSTPMKSDEYKTKIKTVPLQKYIRKTEGISEKATLITPRKFWSEFLFAVMKRTMKSFISNG